jgi:hypothetical protein
MTTFVKKRPLLQKKGFFFEKMYIILVNMGNYTFRLFAKVKLGDDADEGI